MQKWRLEGLELHAPDCGQGVPRTVVRVVLAETARVRPGAEPHPCDSSRRRVTDLQACARAGLRRQRGS